MTTRQKLLSVEMGTFTCEGDIVLCDSHPSAAILAATLDRDHPQVLTLRVRPGTYRIIYLHDQEDGPDSIPMRVDVIHGETAGLKDHHDQILHLTVEGGRIAIIDAAKIRDEKICRDFRYEHADTILHDCGIVISTQGDGDYDVEVFRAKSEITAFSILIDDDDQSDDA